MDEIFHFQVNLGGMLDVLSNHLYKRSDVFVRELLQNGMDAITMRQKAQPGWNCGKITIDVTENKRLAFKDNGNGLTEKEIHQFLAVIGQSSKGGKIGEDFIGQFGIGLLSCFMVSDSITVVTRPASGGPAHRWCGLANGTYTLETLEGEYPTGTTVILNAKLDEQEYFTYKRMEKLVCYYGLVLPVPVHFSGHPERINRIPDDFVHPTRNQLLAFGQWLFEEEFLEAIPIHTKHLDGIAYVLPYPTAATLKNRHRIYLKQMLLTEQGESLLPPWAFFLRCFLNTRGLRPTASREDFYEDESLEEARMEFTSAISQFLEQLHQENPHQLQRIVQIHSQALKAMAVWNDELFCLIVDYLSFETSEGEVTGKTLKKAENVSYIGALNQFRQLKPIFMAQGKLLVCAGYTYDRELLEKLNSLFQCSISSLSEEMLNTTLEALSSEDERVAELLLGAANRGLEAFDCRAEGKRFLPADLPVLYLVSDEVRFLREIKEVQNRENLFSDVMTSLLSGVEEQPLACLYFNLNAPLIRRLCEKTDVNVLKSVARILYVQAMLAGGYPLQGQELRVINQELLNLVEGV